MTKHKRIVILSISIITLCLCAFLCWKILFKNEYRNLEINTTIKYVKIVSLKHKVHTITNSDDIDKLIEYLNALEIREPNNYEKIVGKDKPTSIKRPMTIQLYNSETESEESLIMEIQVIGNYIIINDKFYKISDNKNIEHYDYSGNVYENILYDIVKYSQ